LAVHSAVPPQPAPHLLHALRYHEVLAAHEVNRAQHQQRRSSDGSLLEEHRLELTAYNRTFHIVLEPDTALFRHGFAVYTLGEDRKPEPVAIAKHNYLRGSLADDPTASAWLYINGDFILGTIATREETYYLEPSRYHYGAEHGLQLIVYALSDLRPEGWRMGEPTPTEPAAAANASFCGCGEQHLHGPEHAADTTASDTHADHLARFSLDGRDASPLVMVPPRRRSAASDRARRAAASSTFNTCLVTVVSDHRFFLHHASNIADTTAVMLNHVEAASRIFRVTQFGSFSGLSMAVREVLIERTAQGDPFSARSTWEVSAMLQEFSTQYDFSRSW
jgi:hypothetical protein